MRTIDLIMTDLARTNDRPTPTSIVGRLKLVAGAALTAKGIALIGFRLSHRTGEKSRLGAAFVKQITHVITGADIGYAATIGPGLRIVHPTGVVITDKAVIGSRFAIQSCATVGADSRGAPIIGDDVSLGPGCRVLGAVRIGNRVYVAANAVVTRTIEEEGVVLAGVPARVLRQVTDAG